MKYEPIEHIARQEVEAILTRNDPEELLRAVLSVALHSEDSTWANSVCLRLSTHHHFNVQGNAILGLGHLARRFGDLDPAARGVIETGLRDTDSYARGQAEAAADDAQHLLRWRIDNPKAGASQAAVLTTGSDA